MIIKTQRGFTLIELVMVITIMGIVAAILGPFLAQPFTAYQALSRRTELVSQLNSTMDQMTKDINLAVPNSLRQNAARTSLEMMNTTAMGRYRYSDTYTQDAANNPTADNDATALAPTLPDASFNVLGAITVPKGSRVIVNNVDAGVLYANAAADPNAAGVITPALTAAGTAVAGPPAETRITLNSAFQFDLIGTGSPSKRVYFSNTAVRYVCANGQINRISTYQPQQNIGDALPANTTTALVVDNVAACDFNYSAGTPQRGGVVTIRIQLTRDGESVTLVQQVQVPNAP